MKVVVAFLALASVAFAQLNPHPFGTEFVRKPTQPVADEAYRLPTATKPVHYTVELEPFFEAANFNGNVEIEITVEEATSDITLHVREIEINSVAVRDSTGAALTVNSYNVVQPYEFLVISVDGLTVGQTYFVTIDFVGILNDRNEGFYLAKYDNAAGQERLLGTTQFEATEARLAFPSYDEPALKATFDIKIIRPADYNAVSNMPLVSSENVGDKVRDTFQTTVKQSSYLIAFVVSDFGVTSAGTHDVYGRPEPIANGDGQFALDTSSRIISAMEAAVDVPYTLPKMSQIGLPNGYFSAGAMENWGCVTYREAYLLYTEGVSSEDTKLSIATIIAHEYGHQWFGNLVSPQWWQYLWLNEGFATYFEYFAANDVFPEWELLDYQLVNSVQYAMSRDTRNTRPMTQPVDSPQSISNLFDVVSYDKSGSILRMVHHFLGLNVFQSGLNNYLNARQFADGAPDYLFAGLQQAVDASGSTSLGGLTVKEIMDTWHLQKGYPLLTVTRDYSTGAVALSQNRFIENDPSEQPEIFSIPINYATPGSSFESTLPTSWLTERDGEIVGVNAASGDWLVLNIQATGYFRINYDDFNWDLLIEQLNTNPSAIHELNVAQIVDDLTDLGLSGFVSIEKVFKMLPFITKETRTAPILAYMNAVSDVDNFLSANTELQTKFRLHIAGFIEALYNNAAANKNMLARNQINHFACKFGLGACLTDAQNMLLNAAPVNVNDQKYAYCGAMRNPEQTAWKFAKLYQKFLRSDNAHEQKRILDGMACSNDEQVLSRLISAALGNDETFKLSQVDAYELVLSIIAESSEGAKLVSKMFVQNVHRFQIKFNEEQMATIMYKLAGKANDRASKLNLTSLLRKRAVNVDYDSLVDIMSLNIAKVEKYYSVIEKLL